MLKYQNWKSIQNLQTLISIYYNKNCLLQWKENVLKKKTVIQLKRVCTDNVIPVTWLS